MTCDVLLVKRHTSHVIHHTSPVLYPAAFAISSSVATGTTLLREGLVMMVMMILVMVMMMMMMMMMMTMMMKMIMIIIIMMLLPNLSLGPTTPIAPLKVRWALA